MQICGIVSEYNPFHNGHLYQIEKTRENGATHIVSVMSGNFVQRGDVACFSKFARAKAAVCNGVDLVIEIPTPMAMAPARNFALGAVSILKNIGANMISFGSECGDVDKLKQTAKSILLAENSSDFKDYLKQGKSHIVARQEVVAKNFSQEYSDILSTPNNLLGIEYLMAMNELNFDMNVFSITRQGVLHDSKDTYDNIASASQIRQMVIENGIDSIKKFVPESAFEIYKEEVLNMRAPCVIDKLNDILLYKLLITKNEDIEKLFDITEGLENRIIKAVKECDSFDEIVDYVSTKRYTKSRIRRILLNIILDINEEISKSQIPYCRVLALNEKGREILKNSKDSCEMFVSPKFSNIYKQNFKLAFLEEKATNIYNLTSPKRQNMLSEFNAQVFIKK